MPTLWYFRSPWSWAKRKPWAGFNRWLNRSVPGADTAVGAARHRPFPSLLDATDDAGRDDLGPTGPEAFMTVTCRGVRGATTADANTEDAILAATRELLAQLVGANGIEPPDIASVYFTATPDLNAAFPAKAARQLGWLDTALMCAQEMDVPGQPPRCIRVLIHWNTGRPQAEIEHVYLRGAVALRPDRAASSAPLA
jgi:chorismate mutase